MTTTVAIQRYFVPVTVNSVTVTFQRLFVPITQEFGVGIRMQRFFVPVHPGGRGRRRQMSFCP